MPVSADELAQQSVMNLAGMLILTAIPVVAFALWCDYFERYFKARIEERETVDRAEEASRLRLAGFFMTLFQILIFFGTTPVRREHPAIAYPVFTIAMFAQIMIQKSLELKIFENNPGEKKASTSFYLQAFRTFFWSAVAGLTYVTAILTSVFLFSVVAVVTHAPMFLRVCLLLTGMGVGVVGGLCLTFAMGALFVRKIMAAKTAPEGDFRTRVLSLFAGAKIQAPDLWVVEIPQFHLGSAMMAGFPKGRGWFRPGFFISSNLIEKLSEDEMRAVILHEISHYRLSHLRKRFSFSAGLILCASLITGMIVLLARHMGVPEQGQGTVAMISLITCFVSCFQLLARLVKYQEFSADIHSIEKLGSTLGDLSAALRKLDRLNGALPGQRDLGAKMLSLGHPATEYRIKILEKYFAHRAKQAEAAAKAEAVNSQDKAA